MSRLLAALACLTAIPVLVAAPVPAHLMPRDPPLGFPTRVGTTWVYEGNYGKRTIVISAKEEKGEYTLVTTEWVDDAGKRTPHMVTRVSVEGVFLVAEGGQKYENPWCILKLPHREGQTWETRWRYTEKEGYNVGTMTAGPFEKVRVPAGAVTAARIEWECGAAASGKVTYWYAHGIGLVKMDENMVLKSFAPGKD
jgi:hypothetical protein